MIIQQTELDSRDFLQVVSVRPQYEQSPGEAPTLSYDAEWLAVMRKTHNLLSTSRGNVSVPSTVQPATPTVMIFSIFIFIFMFTFIISLLKLTIISMYIKLKYLCYQSNQCNVLNN